MDCLKLLNLSIDGIKDVEHGEIKFPVFQMDGLEDEEDFPSIVGLYGYNGSGKTAVIDAIYLLNRFLWFGTNISNTHFNDFVCKWVDNSCIKYSFILVKNDLNVKIDYSISFKNSTNLLERSFDLLEESFSYSLYDSNANRYGNKITPLLINYGNNESEIILSDKAYMNIRSIFDGELAFQNAVNLQTLKNECAKNGTSMILSEAFIKVLEASESDRVKKISSILSNFYKSLKHGLYVYSVKMDAESNLGNSTLIGISKSIDGDELGYGILNMPLDGSFEIEEKDYVHYLGFVRQINILLKAFVPSFDSDLIKIESRIGTNKSGKSTNMVRVQYVRIINGKNVAFSAESNGIKKLVNIASALILAYNDPNVILAIDELDSGVFEFLLGQILDVLGNGLKGQLIFTAHNITALSVLDKAQLYFTTTNPKNRYIKLRNMQSENNPESFYMRALKVGGQKEKLMDETHRGEISRALRAGFLQNNK